MLHKNINITADGRVSLVTYILPAEINGNAVAKRPAIIILPGGAFTWLSETEAEPVALTFLKEGFNTFVLNYSVGDYSEFPNPLDDVSKAIWEVRSNASEWNIDANSIFLMGFSAGAGVAAMSATQWNTSGLAERLGIPEEGIKPNAAVIGYGASLLSTIFDNQDDDIYVPEPGKITADRTPEMDVVNYVSPDTAPMFFWHNRYDIYVPVINPLLMAEAMSKHKLPFELHIFQQGEHGMSVDNNLSHPSETHNTNVGQWIPLVVNWLRQL